MPRAANSKAGSIVNFFRTAPMEVAVLVLGLCKDEIADRNAKVAKIREGQQAGKKKAAKVKPAKAVAIPAAAIKPAKVRKRKSRAKARHAVPADLPIGDAETAGDLDLRLLPEGDDDHIAGSGNAEAL